MLLSRFVFLFTFMIIRFDLALPAVLVPSWCYLRCPVYWSHDRRLYNHFEIVLRFGIVCRTLIKSLYPALASISASLLRQISPSESTQTNRLTEKRIIIICYHSQNQPSLSLSKNYFVIRSYQFFKNKINPVLSPRLNACRPIKPHSSISLFYVICLYYRYTTWFLL